MNEERLKRTIRDEMEKVIGLSGETLSEARTELKAAYFGRPFDADIERRSSGWSTYQDRSVLEVVEWAKPGLLRVFTTTDEIVRYEPNTPAQEQNAEDATTYVNTVVFGHTAYSMIHDIIHDALTQRVAWGKVYLEEPQTIPLEYSGLNEEEVQMLVAESYDPAQCRVIQDDDGTFTAIVPDKPQPKKVVVVALPPENVVWAKDTRDMESCRFVAHWEDRPISELVAKGYDREKLEASLQGSDDKNSYPETDIQDEINSGSGYDDQADLHGDMRTVRVYESYVLLPDKDGPRRYKVVFIGEECASVLEYEEWRLPRPPLFPVSSFPLPHSIDGLCLADQMMDIQKLRTELFREALDNMALANQGEFIVQRSSPADRVDMDQFLDRRVGGVYELLGANIKVYPLPVDSKAAQQAISALQQTDALKEVRTGIGQQVRGLTADALQNTATGAIIQEDSANQRLEMIARIIAENFFKPLAKYVLVLVSRHQNKQLQIRLKGQFYNWDPKNWDPNMDVSVSVGLGTGSRAKQVQALQLILGLQEKLIGTFQKASPVGLVEVIRAMHKLTTSLGFGNPEQFFGSIERAQQSMQQIMSQPPQPTKEQQKIQVEQQKVQMQGQAAQAKAQNAQFTAQAKAQTQQNQSMQNMWLKQQELQNKMQLEREKMAVNAQLKSEQIKAEERLDQTRMLVQQRTSPGSTVIKQASV